MILILTVEDDDTDENAVDYEDNEDADEAAVDNEDDEYTDDHIDLSKLPTYIYWREEHNVFIL